MNENLTYLKEKQIDLLINEYLNEYLNESENIDPVDKKKLTQKAKELVKNFKEKIKRISKEAYRLLKNPKVIAGITTAVVIAFITIIVHKNKKKAKKDLDNYLKETIIKPIEKNTKNIEELQKTIDDLTEKVADIREEEDFRIKTDLMVKKMSNLWHSLG